MPTKFLRYTRQTHALTTQPLTVLLSLGTPLLQLVRLEKTARSSTSIHRNTPTPLAAEKRRIPSRVWVAPAVPVALLANRKLCRETLHRAGRGNCIVRNEKVG